jgi:hypothetical protein
MEKGQICTKAVHECLTCKGCKSWIKWGSHGLMPMPSHRSACLRVAASTEAGRASVAFCVEG